MWLAWLIACGGSPDDSGKGARPYVFEPFVGEVGVPDALNDRLCVEPSDPQTADAQIFVDCRTEGANLAPGEPPEKDTVRVVAWNLERGLRIDEQLPALDGFDADVFLISEADRGCARTNGRNVPYEVADVLGLNYVFAVEFVELPRPEPMGEATDSCEHGNFVASRYPIGNVEVIRHRSNLSWYEEGERRLGGRVAITADVKVGEKLLHATVVHFESKIAQIDIQVDQAEETALHSLGRPYVRVVGGDTNAPLYGADLLDGTTRDGTTQAFLSRGFTDTHIDVDPAERDTIEPGFIIDLIFTTEASSAPGRCAESGCGGLSDHRAVWADIAL